MNHKQKCFHTALGAMIMLIGMGIGVIISPPLIAQDSLKKGVFSEIECRRLIVRDKTGKKAVALYAEALGNSVALYNSEGKRVVILSAGKRGGGNLVTLRNESAKDMINLSASEQLGTTVLIKNPAGKGKISLVARQSENSITIRDKAGEVLWKTSDLIDKPKRRRGPVRAVPTEP